MEQKDNEIKLADLAPGDSAWIVRIIGGSPFKKRLLEMGLVRGEAIEKVKLAPLADPAEYIIKSYHISISREEGLDIIVKK